MLESNSNLFTNVIGQVPTGFTHTPLPFNLSFSKYNLITGVPTITGLYSIELTQNYTCTGNSSRVVRFSIEILPYEKLFVNDGILFSTYSSSNTLPYVERKIKNLNFYHTQDNRFYRYFDNVTGYGDTSFDASGENLFVLGQIENPTGWREALVYQTGVLTGLITGPQGTFTWFDQTITGIEPFSQVYINEITGTKQATNIIYFNTGLLSDGDVITINDYSFFYSTTPSDSIFAFQNLDQLIINLNSGANDINSPLYPVGVTGFVDSQNLHLYSYLLSGEDGNSIRVYRNTAILEAIEIPNRYFTSGETLRPTTNSWKGNFVSSFESISAENTGTYTINYFNPTGFDNISGTLWLNSFSGNYTIDTGIKTVENATIYSGLPVNYISSTNIYSGIGVIPSGQNRVPTGFNVDILKRNYYDISGNIAKYTISGEDFLFTGLIEG